jgi:hypothetical protein
MKKWFKEWDAIIVVYAILASIIMFQMYYGYQLKQELKIYKNDNKKPREVIKTMDTN